MNYRRVLCAVDFSEPSRAAMRAAANLTKAAGGELTLVHVVEYPLAFAFPEVPLEPSVIRSLVAQGDETLTIFKAEALALGAPKVATLNVTGTPWSEIVDQAQHGSFDLIVISTHGRTGIKHVLLGSVAERVVRHASVDVLVVRK